MLRNRFQGLSLVVGATLAVLLTQGCGDDKPAIVDAGNGDTGGGADAPQPEPLRIVAGPATLPINEGSSGTILVVLNRAPDAPVTLTVASSNAAAVAVAPVTLTFSAANAGVPQAIVVTGVQDENTQDETATVTISGAGLTAVSVAVAVADDDVQAIVVTPPSLSLTEGGTPGTATVRLAFAPAAPFAVTVTSTDPARLSVTPVTLNFTAENYALAQTITLSALDDDDSVTNNAQIVLKGEGVADALIAVTLIDDDVQSLVFAPAAITIDEADADGGTFTVRLARQPDREIKVALAALNAPGITVTPGELTFTAANYQTPQTVKVVAAADNNTINETFQVTAVIAGLTPQTVAVTVVDKDTQAIVIAPEAITVLEGATGTFTVKLAFDPGASTTVTLSSADAAAASVSPATLTFNSANYASAQTVTVTGVQDDDVANESVVVTASSAGVPNKTTTVTVTDNDTQAIRVEPAGISVVEGETEDLSVRLAFRPSADVVVTVTSADPLTATAAPATLTFNSENFATAQTVVVTGVTDADLDTDNTTLSLTSPVTAAVSVPVEVVDNDTQNILVSPSSLALDEGGASKTFTARLAFAPQAPVEVTVTSSNPKVTFSPSTFNLEGTAAQTITVSPTNDDDAVDEVATLTLVAAGLDNRTVTVNVKDAQTQAHLVAPIALDVTEEGAPGTFTVRLQARPLAATTVTVSSADPGTVVVSTNAGAYAGSSTLTFLPENFSITQTVSVRGLSDLNLVDELVVVTVSSSVAPSAAVLVRNQEDDLQELVATPASITVLEGTPNQLFVSLMFQPVSSVAVAVTSANDTIVKVNGGVQANLTFTTTNWNEPQAVVLTTPDDPDQIDRGPTTLTVSSPGLASKTITATAIDDDDQLIVATPTVVQVVETQTATFTVQLAFTPIAATEVITVTSGTPGKATVFPASITFDAANYNVPVTVTVTGVNDADILNEIVQVTLDSNAAGTPDRIVTVNVADNDTQAILVDPSQIDLVEGGDGDDSSTFNVRLQFDPTTTLVVTLTSPDTGAVTVSPATITFDNSNYQDPVTVTVTAVNDDDVRDEKVVVGLTAEGVQTAQVTVDVEDDDTQGIVTALEKTVVEGATATIPVKLLASPTAPVTITATSELPGKFTVSPATLTFDSGNWNLNQEFVISGVSDADLDDHTDNLVLAITSGQGNTPREGASNATIQVTVADDDSQTILVLQEPAAPFVLSVQEQGPIGTFKVKLGHKPRKDENDVVLLTQTPAGLTFLEGTSLSFDKDNWNIYREVKFRGTADEDDKDVSVTVGLSITEPDDYQPEVTRVPPTASQVVRVIDDEVPVIARKTYEDLRGATELTRRANVAFGTTLFGFTARNAGGETVVARDSRELSNYFAAAPVAAGGVTPTTETIDFDGTGFNVFSSDATGVVYKRLSQDLASVLTPAVTIAPGDVDDFWPVRTSTGFAIAYRRGTGGNNKGLFFRTVQLDGTFGIEQPITSPAPTQQQGIAIHYVPGSTFNGEAAPFLVLYSNSQFLRCARLSPTGAGLGLQDFQAPVYFSSVQNPQDPADIALAYYDNALGLVAQRIRPGTTTGDGACDSQTTRTLRGISSGVYRSVPAIAFNGEQFAVSFDVFTASEDRVGVALWNGGSSSVEMLIGGGGTGSADLGSRPSITWAGDRWVVRYQSETGAAVKVRTGAFKLADLVIQQEL